MSQESVLASSTTAKINRSRPAVANHSWRENRDKSCRRGDMANGKWKMENYGDDIALKRTGTAK